MKPRTYQLPPGKRHRWLVSVDGQTRARCQTASTAYFAREQAATHYGVSPSRIRVSIIDN